MLECIAENTYQYFHAQNTDTTYTKSLQKALDEIERAIANLLRAIEAGIFNEKTGYLVNLKPVTDDNDIMIITTGGTIIRMHADTISCIGRSTRGVRVMNVKDSEVATVDVTERDDEAETQAPEETAADLSPEDLMGEVEPETEEEEIVGDDEVAEETPDEE